MSPVLNKANTFNGQSLLEEIFNSISHGIGALLAVAGVSVLLVYSAMFSSPITITSMALYGLGLIVLYCNSALYHAIPNFKVKSVLQILDHCSIFLLIWGTYVPVALSLVGGTRGMILFSIQTICMVAGIILNAIDFKRWKKLSLVLYLVMGWCVVINANMVLSLIDNTSALLLFIGGLSYTIGVYFYVNKNKLFSHFIWHLFVLAGSVFHYFFVFRCCL